MLHEILWNASRDLAEACLAHPFVQRLAAGSLDPRDYDEYVRQDAFYLRAFLKAYALALARCDDLDGARSLLELAAGALEELELHQRRARQAGFDLESVRPNPACLAYTDFLLATAWSATLGEILAAMTPCMRLYAWLGQQLAPHASEANPYRDWILTYAGDDFQRLAGRIEALLDRFAADTPAIREAYRYAMECELRFFSAVARRL